MSKVEARHIKWILFHLAFGSILLFLLHQWYHLYAADNLHRSFHRANVEHEHFMEKEKSEEDHLNAVNQLHQSLHLSRTEHEHEDDKFP